MARGHYCLAPCRLAPYLTVRIFRPLILNLKEKSSSVSDGPCPALSRADPWSLYSIYPGGRRGQRSMHPHCPTVKPPPPGWIYLTQGMRCPPPPSAAEVGMILLGLLTEAVVGPTLCAAGPAAAAAFISIWADLSFSFLVWISVDECTTPASFNEDNFFINLFPV